MDTSEKSFESLGDYKRSDTTNRCGGLLNYG